VLLGVASGAAVALVALVFLDHRVVALCLMLAISVGVPCAAVLFTPAERRSVDLPHPAQKTRRHDRRV